MLRKAELQTALSLLSLHWCLFYLKKKKKKVNILTKLLKVVYSVFYSEKLGLWDVIEKKNNIVG